MTETDDTLTISRGAILCRLEGFGAAPEALGALGAHICGHLAMRGTDDGALPLPDPATLARLVGPQVAARIAVDAEGSRLVLRLRAAEDADAAAPSAPRGIRVVKAPRADVEAVRAAGSPGATATAQEGPFGAEDEAALRHTLEQGDTGPGGASEAAGIFASADSRMSESALRQRSSAYRHLRAARASPRAAAGAGEVPEAGADDTPYRGDLAAARGEAPPPPLRLEPSQRVDAARQVAGAETAGAGAASFAVFAEEMGAITLPDRLEAAAAWLADIRGRAAFPRAVLLETLSEADGAAPPLDEALAACARMLRAGRLEARPGGTLAPTDTTRFRRAARRGDRSDPA